MIYIQIRWRRAGYMKARIPGGAILIAAGGHAKLPI
jgi:hypothetical protein